MLKTLISFLLLISFAAPEKPSPVIVAGVGTDSLMIGKTKITEVFARYGKRDDFNFSIIQGTDFVLHINHYYYRKQDLVFMTNVFAPNGEDTVNAVVSDIVFGAKSGARTKEGIVIGVDTLGKVKAIYGEPEKIQESGDDRTFIYTKKGISFTGDAGKGVVYEIEVFRVGLFGSHY
jgi:hypothetical protein